MAIAWNYRITSRWRWLNLRDPKVLEEVKRTLALLAERAPGKSVEVRIPPYAAIQCIEGPAHRRGTPPNTVEMDAPTWLALAAGELDWGQALPRIRTSGSRADLSPYLPLEP